MITPKFSLSQDRLFIFIKMHVPHLKLNETDIHVEEDEVYFHSKPYFLRLHLPGKVVEDERTKSSYDADSGWLSISLPKQNEGEVFDNLDMLTKLLTPKHSSILLGTNVEVISSDNNQTAEKDQNDDIEDGAIGEDFDWFIEQTPNFELDLDSELLLSKNLCYGFASQKTSPLDPLTSELYDMIDLKNPDTVPRKQRAILRFEQEKDKFDCEHYLADFFEEEQIMTIISGVFKELTGNGLSIGLYEEQREQLLKLPRKEYIIEDTEISSVYLGLVDILFSYAFDYRQTGGEHSVESDWTICKLSSTLSWLDSFTDLGELVISSCRRCLCFPLYRNWKLFEKVLSDVQLILQAGKTQILKCLLGVNSILRKSETRYPLADIYLVDYCVWIQSACPKKIESMSQALQDVRISKKDVCFSLPEMEEDAVKLMEEDSDEETDVDKLTSAIVNKVCIVSDGDDSDDDESESSSDESDEVSSSSESGDDSSRSLESELESGDVENKHCINLQ